MSDQPMSCRFSGLDVYICDSEVSLLTQCNDSSGVFKVEKGGVCQLHNIIGMFGVL